MFLCVASYLNEWTDFDAVFYSKADVIEMNFIYNEYLFIYSLPSILVVFKTYLLIYYFHMSQELFKSGPRVFSGPVEKVLKWHKSLQDIGILIIYEIVGKLRFLYNIGNLVFF